MLNPVRNASNRAVTNVAPDRPAVPAHHNTTTNPIVTVAMSAATAAMTLRGIGSSGVRGVADTGNGTGKWVADRSPDAGWESGTGVGRSSDMSKSSRVDVDTFR